MSDYLVRCIFLLQLSVLERYIMYSADWAGKESCYWDSSKKVWSLTPSTSIRHCRALNVYFYTRVQISRVKMHFLRWHLFPGLKTQLHFSSFTSLVPSITHHQPPGQSQHAQIMNLRLSPTILWFSVVCYRRKELCDSYQPSTSRLTLKHLQFLFRWMRAHQLSKTNCKVHSVKTTAAWKRTYHLLSSPNTFFPIPFNLLSVALSNRHSRSKKYSKHSQLRNQHNAQPRVNGAAKGTDLRASRLCSTSHKYWMHLLANRGAGNRVVQPRLPAPMCCEATWQLLFIIH